MIGNLAVAHLVPVNVLNLEVFARGLHADQEPAVDGTGRDASVGSTHAAANDHRVTFGGDFDHLHLPIGKSPKDILQIVREDFLATHDALCAVLPVSAVMLHIFREVLGGLAPLPAIHQIEMLSNDVSIALRFGRLSRC